MDKKKVEILFPTFVEYVAHSGYATTSDAKTIIVKWYEYLEWLSDVGKGLNDL